MRRLDKLLYTLLLTVILFMGLHIQRLQNDNKELSAQMRTVRDILNAVFDKANARLRTSSISSTLPALATTILVNQAGYPSDSKKVAVLADPITGYNSGVSYTPGTLQVRSYPAGSIVHTGSAVAWNGGVEHPQSGDRVWHYTFSTLTTAGQYYVYDMTNALRSPVFTISTNPYLTVMKQLVRMFYYQRRSVAKPAAYAGANWADTAGHIGAGQTSQARSVLDQSNPGTAKNLQGGHYDAGDYNGYTVFAVYALADLLHAYLQAPTIWGDNYTIPESGNGIPDLLDEIKFELDWLLLMQAATGDGSVLSKLSALNGGLHASPASTDTTPFYWGAASTASTACAGSMFALGAIAFNTVGMTPYGTTLRTAAEAAYTWATVNPTIAYTNTGFSTANPEPDTYGRDMCRLQLAVYLYALTGTGTYKSYVEAQYTNAHAIAWSYWYGTNKDDVITQLALQYYSKLGGITAGVKTSIENNKIFSAGGAEFLGATTANPVTDPYNAYMKDADWFWGSNYAKCAIGNVLVDMNRLSLDAANATGYRDAGAGYWHYLLGVNPMNLAYVTNMSSYGITTSANSIWHAMWYQGTIWAKVGVSLYGPPPGYIPGGSNPADNIGVDPPDSQPIQKSYLDDNFDNAGARPIWVITEPGNYYQAACIRLGSYWLTSSS